MAKMSRPVAAKWLRQLIKEEVIQKVKSEGKMPFYIASIASPVFQTRKKLFALEQLEKTGFLSHLAGLKKASTVIIFGSMSRWDWYKDSDIDVFIYGDPDGLDEVTYWKETGREIQTFICKEPSDFDKFAPGLLRNILAGYIVKGTLEFAKVTHA